MSASDVASASFSFFFIAIAVLIANALLAIIPANIAMRKGYSKPAFWLLGFFVSFFIALIIALFLEPKNGSHAQAAKLANGLPSTVKCPHCAEFISSEAKICKHCQREVAEEIAALLEARNAEIDLEKEQAESERRREQERLEVERAMEAKARLERAQLARSKWNSFAKSTPGKIVISISSIAVLSIVGISAFNVVSGVQSQAAASAEAEQAAEKLANGASQIADKLKPCLPASAFVIDSDNKGVALQSDDPGAVNCAVEALLGEPVSEEVLSFVNWTGWSVADSRKFAIGSGALRINRIGDLGDGSGAVKYKILLGQ